MKYLNIELAGIDKNGKQNNYKLSDFKGNNLVVYFYPSDDTPVCTLEAESFRNSSDLIYNYADIIGVSADDIESHIDFQNKYNLNFILLSDINNKLKTSFKESTKLYFDIKRTTFIINKDGIILNVWEKVDIDNHIDEVLNFLKKI